jgi:hypothetical protein
MNSKEDWAKPDKLVWRPSSFGDLTFKDAYLFNVELGNQLSWAKTIWSIDIPPTKSLLVWRLMHDKTPTDENLMFRGCNLASQCSLLPPLQFISKKNSNLIVTKYKQI